jgi:integrase
MRACILPALGKRPVSEVSRRDVAALHAAATRRGVPCMANRAVNVLSIFYSHLEGIEAIPPSFNPARRPPRNPEQRRGEHASVRLSHHQEARLVREVYAAMESDPVGATALLTLLDTGRRLREVLGLEWRRLDLDAGTADLGATKGKVAGDVCYLTARVCDAIRHLPRVVGCPYVFTGHGRAGRRQGLRTAWERVKKAAGLEELSPELAGFHLHDLRHHRISELLAAGVAPQLVARQVGHTSLEQLRTYSHLEVADVAAVLSRLNPVMPAEAASIAFLGAGQ